VIYSDCNWEKIPRLNPSESGSQEIPVGLLGMGGPRKPGDRTLAVVSIERSCAASAKVLAIVFGGLDGKARNSRISGVKSARKEALRQKIGIYGVRVKDL
jgi:hypothetical protein